MIRRVKRAYAKEEVLGLMEPLVAQWFDSKFKELTEPQAYAVPLIHGKKNVIVSSPTGSGKTLTAFLSIINELMVLSRKKKLEDKIYCVYISPLKALANDINKNLNQPLAEMRALAEKGGIKAPDIRTGIRHGDTSPYERQRMARNPPHIFITTPETLSIVLSTPKFRQKFTDVKYVIVDEIHELCSNKRGALLSLALERLQENAKKEFVRIGLSATIAPMDEVAKFLAGFEKGKMRDMSVVEVEGTKKMELKILCPVEDILSLPADIVNAQMYAQLKELIEEHRTTLIFTNTRSGTEHVVYKLKDLGQEDIEAHHGSLSKFIRLDVEDKLKSGALKAVVSSTSLELGIDIGYIDLVCQIGSPKSIAKGLQRVGRAGHAYGDVSKGYMLVFDNDDLMECATIAKNAYDNRIDRVDIPTNCLDVLAQSLIGMSLEKKWDEKEAYELLKRSYTFRNLKKDEFREVLDYLSSREEERRIYSKIWFDEEERTFGRKRGSRLIYYTNVGTIPEEGSYTVISERGQPVGELSEKFVEHLSTGDVFVLGGKPYVFERARGMTVYTKGAEGRRPTVPSWAGEMLPRSFDLAREVGEFRRAVLERLDGEGESRASRSRSSQSVKDDYRKRETRKWLIENYRVDEGAANSIINYVEEQRAINSSVPTDKDFLVEGYTDVKGNANVIFHFCLGRRVNDALSRAYAFAVSKEYGCNVKTSVTDDNFMLTLSKRIELGDVAPLLKSRDLEETLKKAVRHTELFKQRFRHCATRSFMILRNYKGREVSVGRQQLRSTRILDYLHELGRYPVIKETYNEILNDAMDVKHAREILEAIESGAIKIHTSEYSTVPSPFAHNVVLQGISDIILMEDRSKLLRELHRRVLKRVMPDVAAKPEIDRESLDQYFESKFRRVRDARELKALMKRVAPINLTQPKGLSVFRFSVAGAKEIQNMSLELVKSGSVESVYTPGGVLWTPAEDVNMYASMYALKTEVTGDENAILDIIKRGATSSIELSRATGLKVNQVREHTRRLEHAYLIGRKMDLKKGKLEVSWVCRDVDEEPLEGAAKRAIPRMLETGPLTLSEISHQLGQRVGNDTVKAAISELEAEGAISKGNFYGEREEQYILVSDLLAAKARAERAQEEKEKAETIPDSKVSYYIFQKQFGLRDTDHYFELFMDAPWAFDVFNHVKSFDLARWNGLRESGEIMNGRFVGRRARFIKKENADLLASAYRLEGLSEFDRKILEAISSGKGMTLFQIIKKVNEDRDRVKECVSHLDSNLYLIRRYNENENANYYAPFEPGKYIEDSAERIISNYLKGYGPSSLAAIQHYTRFPYEEVEEVLKRLEANKRVATIRTESAEMFILQDELEAFKGSKTKKEVEREFARMRLLSMFDPYFMPMLAQLEARFGDRWLFPLVKEGELKGAVELWEMSGCIEARDIDVEVGLLDEALDTLDRAMEYYRPRGYDILRIARVSGKGIPELDKRTLGRMEKKGYLKVQDYMVKGRLVPRTFEKGDILSHVLKKQGVDGRKYGDILTLVNSQGGARSHLNLKLRIPALQDAEKAVENLVRRGELLKAHSIPPFVAYTTMARMKECRKARLARLSEHEKMVLEVVEGEGSVSREKLLRVSPLGRSNTQAALKSLFEAGRIARSSNKEFVPVDDSPLTRAEARKGIIKRLFQNFGIFSAEVLSMCTGFEFRMKEVRALLRELEDEGFLCKGFLVNGDSSVHWALANELDSMAGSKFDGEFVLSPDDNLWLYLQIGIREMWGIGSCYVVFNGTEMRAAFKARRRKGELVVSEFKGGRKAWSSLRKFAEANKMRLSEDYERVEDWEVMMLYEKTRGGGK